MVRKVLGRGISAIIPDMPTVFDQKNPPLVEIELDKISANPSQPRGDFDPKALQELSKSIEEKGLLQPVVVRSAGDGFQLIVGERRVRAAKLAGIKKIPAVIMNVSEDREMLELALVENLQREDLNPIDQARAYERLVEQCRLTQEEVSQKVRKDRASIANTIRLLKLPIEVQSLVKDGSISAGHARALLGLSDPRDQLALAKRIARGDLSVRAVEQMVHGRRRPRANAVRLSRTNPPEIREIEEQLEKLLGTAVRIIRRGKVGRLEIEFYSDEDLERIIEILRPTGD